MFRSLLNFGIFSQGNMSKPRRVHDALGHLYDYPMEQLSDAPSYHPADIIAFDRPGGYWHYAVVVNVEGDIINIIEYQSMGAINGILASTNSCSAPCSSGPGRAAVARQEIDFSKSKSAIWKVCVPLSDCLQDEEVMDKAMSKLGETVYDLISNNCEHFALWCKTGQKYSSQIIARAKYVGQRVVRAGVRIAGETTGAIVKRLIQNGAGEVTEIAVGVIAMKSLQTVVPKVATRCLAASMIVVDVAVGVACAAWDIVKAKKKLNNGEITKEEFKSAVGTRVVAELCITSFSIAGTLIGCLGGPIGAVVGGVLGALCGTLIASVI